MLFILIGTMFQLNAVAQSNVSEKLAISQILIRQQGAWNKGSIEKYMSYYWFNDSLQFIGKKGITYGWHNTFDNYKKSYPDTNAMGQLTFELNSIDILCINNAFVIGKWFLKREKGKGDLGGSFSLLLKKIKKKWVIVADHSS